MKQPLISVIMGTFNPKKTELERAVDSIINQTFTDWEMLLYDDGSTEISGRMIRDIAAKDQRIHYLQGKKNHGLAYGLNQCIKEAKGKYLARMDDDDISFPDRFEKQLLFLEEHEEYGWVGSWAETFDEHGVWGTLKRPEKPQKEDFLMYSPYIHPSVMFRREIFETQMGYRVSARTARCEDYELFMRLTALGYQGCSLQEVLLGYQEKEDTMNRKFRYCFSEALVRRNGFSQMGLHGIKVPLYILKPLAVYAASLMPRQAQKLRKRRM